MPAVNRTTKLLKESESRSITMTSNLADEKPGRDIESIRQWFNSASLPDFLAKFNEDAICRFWMKEENQFVIGTFFGLEIN